MTEKDYAVYRYLEQVAEENPNKWVSKEELINEFPQYFTKGEDSHDVCSTLNLVRIRINQARAKGDKFNDEIITHICLLKNHQFKLAISEKEAQEYIEKEWEQVKKLYFRFRENVGAITNNGQGHFCDAQGNLVNINDTDALFASAFTFNKPKTEKKYKLSKLIKQDKIAFHTPTEENANALLNALDRLGYEWNSFEKLTSYNHYKEYGENTCYGPSIWLNGKISIGYCSLSFYEKKGREIVEFNDIDLEN